MIFDLVPRTAGIWSIAQIDVPTTPPVDIPTADLWMLVAPIVISIALTFLRSLPANTPDLLKRCIVGAVAAFIAAAGLAAQGRLDFDNWYRTALFILFVAGGFYALLWKPLQDTWIFGIKETAVNPKGVVVDAGH
jgi:phosphoglycerol transferase MdoB-like AlkP superfamily enzyme